MDVCSRFGSYLADPQISVEGLYSHLETAFNGKEEYSTAEKVVLVKLIGKAFEKTPEIQRVVGPVFGLAQAERTEGPKILEIAARLIKLWHKSSADRPELFQATSAIMEMFVKSPETAGQQTQLVQVSSDVAKQALADAVKALNKDACTKYDSLFQVLTPQMVKQGTVQSISHFFNVVAKVQGNQLILVDHCSDFIREWELGRGSTGAVFSVREHFSKKRFALKRSHRDHPNITKGIFGDSLLAETQVLKRLPSIGCQPPPELVVDARVGGDGHVYVLNKLFSGDLIQFAHKQRSDEEKFTAFQQLWEQWIQLFEQGILHSDIAPDNVFMNEEETKSMSETATFLERWFWHFLKKDPEKQLKFSIADFGMANLDMNHLDKFGSKNTYTPADHYKGMISEDQGLRLRSFIMHDIFGLGACFYSLVSTDNPFSVDRTMGPCGRLFKKPLAGYSKDYQNLLEEMLCLAVPETDMALILKISKMINLAKRIINSGSLLENSSGFVLVSNRGQGIKIEDLNEDLEVEKRGET